ncbi:MAG: hypothetical protein O7C67_02395 [Gammaproteobacteria bacterium]|nr:hypothetical protein [Gammaproteobacteria bacterium]
MMRTRNFLAATGLATILPWCIACDALADDASTYELERTSWGAPAIHGVWDFRTLTPLERPPELAGKAVLTAEEARVLRDRIVESQDVDRRTGEASADVEGAYNTFWYDWGTELNEDMRTSLIVDPPDGRLPELTAEALNTLQEQNRLRTPPVRDLFSFSANPVTFRPAGPETLGLSERCLVGLNAGPPLTPSAYNNNLRIVQTPDHVVLVTEMIHDARIIPLDGTPHSPRDVTQWSGDSRGHWDGNTLVVDTTNFTDKTATFQLPATIAALDQSGGVGSGTTLHLIERFTPVGEGRLLYEYTVDDPATFAQNFTVRIQMRASAEPVFEYACHEGNYAMPGILKGARTLEAEEARLQAHAESGR